MDTEKDIIDNNFLNVLREKIDRLKKFAPERYESVINVDSLLIAGGYIDNLKPKSKYREYKKEILEFVDTLERNSDLAKTEIVELIQKHLSPLTIYLKSEHGFQDKHGWFWSGVFNLGLDIILIVTGLAKHYFYIPIFTIIAVIRNLWKLKKSKTENKFLDF